MKELSKRAGERGERIVFKLEYDRGSVKQLTDNHYLVPEKEYLGKSIALPAPEDIPNLDLQVMNYHRPMLGTFHSKYMIVDRKYATLLSNNIQDNDNMEMMTHLEGPIVDSLYDMALISWHKRLEPPLPSHNSPAGQGGLESFSSKSQEGIMAQNGSSNEHLAPLNPGSRKREAYAYEPRAINRPGAVPPMPTNGSETTRAEDFTGPSITDNVTRPLGENGVQETTQKVEQSELNGHSQQENSDRGMESEELGTVELMQENARAAATTADIEHIVPPVRDGKDEDQPANKDPAGQAGGDKSSPNIWTDVVHHSDGPDAASQQFLGSGAQNIPQSQMEHPSSSNDLLPEHKTDDPHYDIDIAGEIARIQTAVSPKQGESRVEAVTRHLNHTKNIGFKGNAPDCAPQEEMTPYIPHSVQEPFPIAMVCREPYGTPNHASVYNPQNEAWLSALRNAKKNVFIQSPTLNAEPLVPAIIEACERGIDVYCYICLGYNDTVGSISHYLNQSTTDILRVSSFRCKAAQMK